MVNRNQVINGIALFMDNHMIPNANGNYKIILRAAKAGMMVAPDKIWETIKNNALLDMVGAINGDHIDLDVLSRILTEAFAEDEFGFSFNLLGSEYKIFLSAQDITTIKSYIERS